MYPRSDSDSDSDSDFFNSEVEKSTEIKKTHSDKKPVKEYVEGDFSTLTGRYKKLFELRMRRLEIIRENEAATIMETPQVEESTRGISKRKWEEEKKKKIEKLVESHGLDISKAYMLDTEEKAEDKYKKRVKKSATAAAAQSGYEVFNQKSLYKAHKKRIKNIEIDLEEYKRMKEKDPEFYGDASSLQYGKAPEVSEEKMERMVKELKQREEKRKSFSRRRRFREERNIDSINERNEHFNKKSERAYGKYTVEIKQILEQPVIFLPYRD